MTTSRHEVSYAACESYEPKLLRPAIERVLEPQIKAFGGSLSGKKLLLKPNWLAWRRSGDVASVNPAFTLELARVLKDAGVSKLTLMENPGVQSAPSIAKGMGIDTELGRMGIDILNFSEYKKISPAPGVKFHNIELTTEHLGFDAVVNLAKGKTHAMMGLTLCVKNLFGMVKGSERMGWHLAVGRDFAMFADMLLDIYLAVKPQFNLLDAVVCMEGNGPGSGDPVQRGFITGSSDALALDSSVAPLLLGEGVGLLLLERAAARDLPMDFENSGDVPTANPLKMPPPPGIVCEWGMPLPPFMKGLMRRFVISRPLLDKKLCIGCGLCAEVCPPKSLKMENKLPRFHLGNCIRCYCCQEHCPKGAISSKRTLAMKAADLVEDCTRSLFGMRKHAPKHCDKKN